MRAAASLAPPPVFPSEIRHLRGRLADPEKRWNIKNVLRERRVAAGADSVSHANPEDARSAALSGAR